MPDIPTQHLPEVSSEDRPHVLEASCWCNPVVEAVPPTIRHIGKDGKVADYSVRVLMEPTKVTKMLRTVKRYGPVWRTNRHA